MTLGDKYYKKLFYAYAEDIETGNPLYILTQLSDLTIDITADSTEVTDKDGNLVDKVYKSKTGTLSATNAFVNMNIIAAASGNTPVFGESGSKIVVPKMLTVKAGTKVDVEGAVDGSIKVIGYYPSGSIETKKLFTKDVSASTTAFSVDTGSHTLELPTDPDFEEYFVRYEKEIEKGVIITNSAKSFPESCRLIIKAGYADPCKKNTIKSDYIELPSFKISPETSLPISVDTQTMDFSGDLEVDYCGTDKVLYKVYDADEVDGE